jgi:hypothetical protein
VDLRVLPAGGSVCQDTAGCAAAASVVDQSVGLWLGSTSLLSKWGFDDGSVPDELYDYLEPRSPVGPGGTWPDLRWVHAVWCEVLAVLVRERLLPFLDQRVEVYALGGGSHNPVRAERVDDVEVPDEVLRDPWAKEPALSPGGVVVPWPVVVRVAQALAGDAAGEVLDKPRADYPGGTVLS